MLKRTLCAKITFDVTRLAWRNKEYAILYHCYINESSQEYH